MRKFKAFFYPIYLVIAFVVLYFSIDILANMDFYKEKVDFTMLRKLPEYLLYLLMIVSILMVTELVAENFHLLNLRRKVRHAEEEVLKLKAKLYDRTEQASDEDEEPEENEDQDDEDDEDDEDAENDEYKLT